MLRAGYISLSDIAFLVAVQATVRGAPVPGGLKGPQKDEVTAWMTELAPRREALREMLGIARDAVADQRPAPVVFEDIDVDEDRSAPRKLAFRWRTHRGGVGLVVGTAAGIAVATAVMATANALIAIVFGSALVGHLVGRKVITPRCSACATVVKAGAKKCPACGAALRGDIDSLSERLEAEERLMEEEAERSAKAETVLSSTS